ncbi:MAG: prepilin peptidase [Acetatifactor sp.]
MPLTVFLYIIVFLYGITIGSFLNVLIYRLPKKENIVTTRSHCMSCGYQLKWYDLVPLFSYLVLRGKCRKCKAKISVQYPLIEGLNGVLYILVFLVYGISVETLLYCLLSSALLALSVIDLRTFEIPVGFQYFIFLLGVVRVVTDYRNWWEYVIGFFAVSVFLYLIVVISKGAAMGGGDVKLMAVCGLLIGWKLILLSLAVGCILGSIIHLLRMKFSGQEHMLAMGPYLSLGIMISILWGNQFLTWYLSGFSL